jgi:anti-sigma factor RsiW
MQEVISGHVRSLMANHLTDVTSSDQHTVKPWFDGKLEFSPPVPDLTTQNFPILGGRLDYVGNRPVAALVYRRRQHVINLFIWPSTPAAGGGETQLTQRGYNLIHWTTAGMVYCTVSNLNLEELQEFVRLVQQHAIPMAPLNSP